MRRDIPETWRCLLSTAGTEAGRYGAARRRQPAPTGAAVFSQGREPLGIVRHDKSPAGAKEVLPPRWG